MGPKWFSRERLGQVMLFLLLLLSYTYTFPRWADQSQNSRMDMVVAVVDDGTFRIDKYVSNTVDYAKVGDHYYSDKAPGPAFLGIPIYAGLRVLFDTPVVQRLMNQLASNPAFVATLRSYGSGILEQKVRLALALVAIALAVGAIPSALLGVLLYRAMARFTPRPWPRLLVVVGYALLTPAFAYANTFYSHQLSAALLFGAFYLVFMPAAPFSRWRLLGAGFLLAYAVICEYPAALMAGGIFIYALYRLWREDRWTRSVWMVPAAAVVGAAWLAYNTVVFGGPLKLGYSYSEQWLGVHNTGFMSLTWPHGEAMWGITFGLFRGLFVLSPLLLLAVPGLVWWWRSGEHRAAFWLAVYSVAAFFLFNSSSAMWWGGFAVGPRYVLPAVPFLALPIVFVFRDARRHWFWKAAGALLYLWSFVATWGLTLAEQAFPPGADLNPNPLVDYAWPNWLAGNIARNAGTLLHLRGPLSLAPLFALMAGLLFAWWRFCACAPAPKGAA